MAQRRPGQRVGLTRDTVLDAAITLADRDGLPALSMRRLGAELGVEAMALYNHVPNKDALLDGLVERLVAGAADELVTGQPWPTGLRDFAHSWLAALHAHPNLVPVVLSRPAVTPGGLALLERGVTFLHEAGFALDRALDILYSVAALVIGHAATGSPSRPTGSDQVQVLAGIDLAGYPLLAEAVRTSRSGPADRFDEALRAMLAGFAP
ncbi:MAG TPA: TetR/AcrR family transcriptional regulator C-terminal domain-containing protein [Mycobacteriales bacterium]|nr:TetR/AcrR family transcriptional regulator C-terminal domain-containing protein [Mycobacteriales bacterium]